MSTNQIASNEINEQATQEAAMYTITTETGRDLTFPSEAAYLAAEDWYNNVSKERAIEFCREHGVILHETERKLIDDWHDVAMHTYATVNAL